MDSRDEVRDAFGTTFPLDQMPPDSSVDQVFKLVDRAFQRLYQSLAAKRLKFLPRETAPEIAGSAYEFPREFRKVVGHATQFLVELSRPNQLEISPFLRGFYFTGVRPVVVTESALEAAAPVAVGAGRERKRETDGDVDHAARRVDPQWQKGQVEPVPFESRLHLEDPLGSGWWLVNQPDVDVVGRIGTRRGFGDDPRATARS